MIKNSNKDKNWFWEIVLLAIALFLILGFYVFYLLIDTFSIEKEGLGLLALLGDFIGGFFNPLFGFVTVLLLIFSIRVQINELKVANHELSLSREETAKSADAVVKQFEHIEKQRRIAELESLLKSYQNKYKENLAKDWPIVEKLLDERGEPTIINFNTAKEKVSYWELMVGWNILHSKYRNTKVDCLKRYRDIEGYSLLISLSEQSAELLENQAEIIAEFITLGMSWRYCELKVSQLYIFVNDCIRTQLLYQPDIKSCYEIIQEATAQRQVKEPNFESFKNRYRNI